MLVAIDLSNAIQSTIKGLSETQKSIQLVVHIKIADCIKNYILSNAVVAATYAGVTAQNSPDPLSGSYSWSIQDIPLLTGSFLKDNSVDFDTWAKAIQTGLCSAVLYPTMGSITIVGAAITSAFITTMTKQVMEAQFSGMTPEQQQQADLMKMSYDYIAQKIIDDFKLTLPLPNPIAATSTTPGTGTVSFISIS